MESVNPSQNFSALRKANRFARIDDFNNAACFNLETRTYAFEGYNQ